MTYRTWNHRKHRRGRRSKPVSASVTPSSTGSSSRATASGRSPANYTWTGTRPGDAPARQSRSSCLAADGNHDPASSILTSPCRGWSRSRGSSPCTEHRVLVRRHYAESGEGVTDIVRAGLPTAEWTEGPVLSTTGELVMFDAAYFGTEVGTLTGSATLDLAAGRYRVDSASIEPNNLTSFRVHRFVGLD
ncbi:Imm21 family immunity protein [Streptomyces poriferorum]|uniref:Imm21 family immunity protein n=1 Tax=Streptomyces poriferorum TaxID=2798799 RepID=A0ABY9ITF7_9ACTN|nr:MULTISPECIES: Imm21 family immunity protein [unclassified Streptomyces]MDP5313504.1 Imm21 family immunity protein [Streptomyces sp. Alt4]WLQ49792.1 Imm21 family immunity protein [Streptomyces sp. Alt1]WLQ57524.1 Imm21 family immunity protein [Streptomyces sp. Alt2]